MDASLTSPSQLLPASPPLKAVLFDWGNTLVRFTSPTTGESSDFAALRSLHAELVDWGTEARPIATLSWEDFRDVYVEVWAEQYRVIAETLREGTMADLFVGILSRLAPQSAGDLWLPHSPLVTRLAERTIELLPLATEAVAGAGVVLEALSGVYPLGVVSNLICSSPVHRSLEIHGLAKYLSVIVVSADVGYIKPSPVPFQKALSALGCGPEEVLFVGDDPTTDMRGAKDLRMRTVLLRQGEEPCSEADFAVDDLGELVALVGNLAEGQLA